MKERNNIQLGDWVKGSSVHGELIQGYVEHIHTIYNTAKVRVVQSDNEKIIGNSIHLYSHSLKKMPAVTSQIEEIKALIDLALETNDKAWFTELTEHLNSTGKENGTKGVKSHLNNKLGSTRF